jgi:hypothetical protein
MNGMEWNGSICFSISISDYSGIIQWSRKRVWIVLSCTPCCSRRVLIRYHVVMYIVTVPRTVLKVSCANTYGTLTYYQEYR